MLYQQLDSSMITQEEGRQKGPVEQLKGCKAGPYSSHCAVTKVFSVYLLIIRKAARQNPNDAVTKVLPSYLLSN